MPNVKVIIGFAAVAAFLSLFAGIFGGVTFGVILLRMILGALAFGVLGAGVSLLIDRFMPDLFLHDQQERSVSDAEEGSQQGGQVDIVLDNEGEEGPDFSFNTGEGNTDAGNTGESYIGADATGEYNTGEEQTEDEEDSFIEEVHRSGEEEDGKGGSPAAGGSAYETGGTAEVGAERASAGSANTAERSGDAGSSGREEGDAFENVGDIDELPDLEEYADSFESVAANNPVEGGQQTGGASSSNVEIDGQQEDPATVAKALRQFMKKDEEG